MEQAPEMGNKITRKNHYVPQLYLNGWAEEQKIWRYELIVPNQHYPIWQQGYVESTGMQPDLYTRRSQGQDKDDWESWFGTFETKASEPLRKAREGKHLNADDWNALVDFVAIQYLRTPAAIAQLIQIGHVGLQEGNKQVSKKLSEPNAKQEIMNRPPLTDMDNMIPMTININRETGELSTSTISGKSTSLMGMKSIMERNARNVLHQNHWGIITCAESVSWPTSDTPVILLNCYGGGRYDFNGGWGRKNTEIIMPISPKKAIYTKVKSNQSPRFHCNATLSTFIRKIIVENAYRFVYSNFEDASIPKLRRRKVDSAEYQEVKLQLDKLHRNYVEKEVPLIDTFQKQYIEKNHNLRGEEDSTEI